MKVIVFSSKSNLKIDKQNKNNSAGPRQFVLNVQTAYAFRYGTSYCKRRSAYELVGVTGEEQRRNGQYEDHKPRSEDGEICFPPDAFARLHTLWR